jgi:hypothetical protein
MSLAVVDHTLELENLAFRGTGGVSTENRGCGFRPAFFDTQTRTVYLSCFADGKLAPCHLWDGLPDDVVLARNLAGRVAKIKASIRSGFVLDGRFFTREEAAMEISKFPVQHMIRGDET